MISSLHDETVLGVQQTGIDVGSMWSRWPEVI
jgi:hypothetical protein